MEEITQKAGHRCESNITMDLRDGGWEGVDWIHEAQDGDQWRSLAKIRYTDFYEYPPTFKWNRNTDRCTHEHNDIEACFSLLNREIRLKIILKMLYQF